VVGHWRAMTPRPRLDRRRCPVGPAKPMGGVAGRHCLRITSSIEHGIALDINATVSASGRPGADSRRITSTSPLCKRLLARAAVPKGAIVPR
jgi:hypothetical protein